ncbi:MAG: ferrous iron transport protein A, partial [Clostridia bacterium]|nr:ferrous iron transport protein A [Clostridia bacterium]
MQKKLCDFAIGESGKVTNVLQSGAEGIKIRRRLFDMGVTPGAGVTLKKRAP